MGTPTTNLSLFKPAIGESRTIWPSELNNNWDIIDALFNASDQLLPVKGGTGAGALTQGSVPFIGAAGVYSQDNANFFWDDSNNWLGLGTASPAARLDLSGDTESTGSLYQRVASTTGSILNKMRRSRGTVAAPTIVSSGDVIGQINFEGYDGGGFLSAAAVRALVSTTPGSNDMPGALAFLTTADGATSPTEAMRITHARRLGIGLTTPLVHVHIAADTEDAIFHDSASATGLFAPQLAHRRARGTIAAPTIVLVNDLLGAFSFQGYDGAAYREAALIRAGVSSTPGVGDMPGNLIFLTSPDGSVTPTEALRITHQQRIGVGITLPLAHLHLAADADDAIFHDVASATGLSAPQIVHRRARGTLAAPTIVNSEDVLGTVFFQGYDGAAYRDAALIRGGVSTTPGAGDMPGVLIFFTTPDGSTTPTEALRITHQQRIGVGVTAPGGHMHLGANTLDQIFHDVASDVASDLPQFIHRRSRTTLAAPAIVQSGDFLGEILFQGHDGVAFFPAARIRGLVSTTPGVNDMPGALSFQTTADGAATTTEALRITHQQRIGAGIAIPLAHLHLAANADDAIFHDVASATGLSAPQIVHRRARGTLAAPTIVNSEDVLGSIFFQGYDGAAYRDAALIRAGVSTTPGAGDMPGVLLFFTTPDGSTTPLEALRITHQRGLLMSELASDHDAPAVNGCVIYVRETGGKTELVARFATGAIQQLAVEP